MPDHLLAYVCHDGGICFLGMLAIFGFMLFLALLCFFLFRKKVRLRQVRNIRTSARVLEKLRSWDGPLHEKRAAAYLSKIDPYVFEELVLSVFESHGAKISRSIRYSGDFGVDGSFQLKGKRFAVQSKRYSGHIKKAHLDAFAKAIARFKYDGGYFVYTGKCSVALAKSIPSTIKLVDARLLVALLAHKSELKT